MAGLSDDLGLPLPCPKCGNEVEVSLTRLKDEPQLVCPACGETFNVDSGGTAGEVADQVDNLDRLLDRFGKS